MGSRFAVNNPSHVQRTVDFDFRKQDGSPFGVVTAGKTSSQASLIVPPRESAFLDVEGTGEGVEAGWALLQSDGPFQASVLFVNRDATESEDGFRTAGAVHSHTRLVSQSR